MSASGPYRDGELHVVSEKCSTCIFRPGNKMHLNQGRVKGMVENAIADETVIVCHKTLEYAPGDTPPATCNGFYESYGDQVPAVRLAKAMNIIAFDEPG